MKAPQERRLGAYSLGFFRQKTTRRILELAGWSIVPGPLTRDLDAIAVWGDRPVAKRGRAAAARRDVPLLHLEDPFYRSVGACGADAPHGLLIDHQRPHFDASAPSDLEDLLNAGPALTEAEYARAQDLISLIAHLKLSKYNDTFRDASELPPAGFVLVVDQVEGDASIANGLASRDSFVQMLETARADHPQTPICIKRHPRAGAGHFQGPLPKGVTSLADGFDVWDILERACSVYCVTSQVGFEAILAGHRPHVFGAPFYAGWGLSEDRIDLPRRAARLDVQTLFHRAVLEYPVWYDAKRDALCDFEKVAFCLQAERAVARVASARPVGLGIRRWKRAHMRKFLGVRSFASSSGEAQTKAVRDGAPILRWGVGELSDDVMRVEDGFIRSEGLGAQLVPALSLCVDRSGLYFDARAPSDLERLIAASVDLPDVCIRRARGLIAQIVESRTSKYNLDATRWQPQTEKPVILVAGQVEDDASVRFATGDTSTNLGLLKAARAGRPDGYIAYKPHPDVEAGLRVGAVGASDLEALADAVLRETDAVSAIEAADEVWTMTSLIGFEALLRGRDVVTVGMPFYAGWGLTEDHMRCARRQATGVTLEGLAHAALVDYPVYFDPLRRTACTPEVLIERLSAGEAGWRRSGMSRLQDVFSRYARFWR